MARQALKVATGERNSVQHLKRSDELGLTLRAVVRQLGLMCRWLINDVSSQVVSVRDGSDRLAQGNRPERSHASDRGERAADRRDNEPDGRFRSE